MPLSSPFLWNPSMCYSRAAHGKLNKFSDLEMKIKCSSSDGHDDGLEVTYISEN